MTSRAAASYRQPGLPIEREHPPLEWRPQRRTALVAIAATAVAVMIHLWDASLRDERARLHPDLVEAASLVPILLLASAGYLIFALVREAAWTVKERRWLVRWGYLGGSVVGHLFLIVALTAGMLFSDRDFLFGERVMMRSTAPDHSKEAFLYGCGFFTSPTIYYRSPGSLSLRQQRTTRIKCDSLPSAHLVWDANDDAAPVDPEGHPLPDEPPFTFNWGGGC